MPVTLKSLLALDSATCALMGAGLLAASGPVGRLTALPPALLLGAGLLLLPIAAFMAWSASRPAAPRWALLVVVAGNVGWAAASLLLPTVGWVAPNALGLALLFGQAAVVAILAGAEWARRGEAATSPLAGEGAREGAREGAGAR